jgi:hypothetical protein
MANLPISGLTASASNLASTDVLPVVQTTGVGPVKMTGLQIAGGLLGSATFNAATITTSQPVLNLSQTWNAGAVTFTGLKFNATDTASANSSNFFDFQIGGSSRVKILAKDKVFGIGAVMTPIITSGIGGTTDLRVGSTGSIFFVGGGADGAVSYPVLASIFNTGTIQTRANASFGWTASTTDASGSADLILTRAAAATLQLGAADTTGTTAPTPQFLRVQSWSSSTNNNQIGADFTIQGSRGTGTGAGGSIIFQVAPAGGSSNGVQNAYATALTINSSQQLILNASSTSTTPAITVGGTAGWYNRGNNWAYGGGGTQILEIAGGVSGGLVVNAAYALCFANDPSINAPDVYLYRDAANTLALKNSTSPQLFRVYSTYTDAATNAFGGIGAAKNLDGTSGDVNTLYIGSQKTGAPTALTKLAIQVDGTTRVDYNITTASTWTFSGGIVTASSLRGSNIYNSAGGVFAFGDTRSTIASSADGRITLMDSNQATFDRLMFGGTTSSFPALKRSSATLQVRLADDTNDAGLTSGRLTVQNSPTVTISIATPAVVTLATHGLHTGAPVVFSTTGALPTGITAGTTYFAVATPGTTGTFNIATTLANALAGTLVNTSGSQSGTHRVTIPTIDDLPTVGSQETTLYGGFAAIPVTITTAYNVLVTDFIITATNTAGVPTFPTAVGALGQMYIFKNNSGGSITPVTTSSQTIDGSAPAALADKGVLRIYSDGANWQTW